MMEKGVFLTHLKNHFPYLYDVNIEMDKIIKTTGYGEVKVRLNIKQKKLHFVEIVGSKVKKYMEKGDRLVPY
jgi:hypothetical protein